MICWVFLILIAILAIVVIIASIAEGSVDGFGGFMFGVILLIAVTVAVGATYQNYIVCAPFKYEQKKRVVADLKEIVGSDQLVLKDMDMGKKISDAIIDLRQFEMDIKSQKVSPFALFKPTIDVD